MRKNLLALAAMAMMSASASAMYIVGDPVEGGWDTNNGIEMTAVDGHWEWTGTIESGQWFVFATNLTEESQDWDLFGNYRLSPDVDNTVAGEGTYNLITGTTNNSFKGAGADCTFVITELDGSYTLTVTQHEEAAPVDLTLYLRGAINEWEALDDYKLTESTDAEGVFTLTVDELSGKFKIATSDWGTEYTSSSTEMVLNESYTVATGGSDMSMSDTCKDVTLTLDTNNMTLTVTENSSTKVKEIGVAESEAVYYNLQGVKIAKPEKGIVIRVANGKSEKVIL